MGCQNSLLAGIYKHYGDSYDERSEHSIVTGDVNHRRHLEMLCGSYGSIRSGYLTKQIS